MALSYTKFLIFPYFGYTLALFGFEFPKILLNIISCFDFSSLIGGDKLCKEFNAL